MSLGDTTTSGLRLHHLIANVGWLLSERVMRVLLGLLVGVWLARYLGPQQYGFLNFAIAFVALLEVLATLGLQNILVRELVRDSKQRLNLLGSAFVLQAAGGLSAYLLVITGMAFLRPDDPLARSLVAILGCTLMFKCSDTARYWFESQVQSRYPSWASNVAVVTGALAKVGAILLQAPLATFAWILLGEAMLMAFVLFCLYQVREGNLGQWRPDRQRIVHIVREGWPMMLSTLAIMVYMRIDQVMLGQMVGDTAVGLYTAAIRLSEIWYIIPMAIATTMFPVFVKSRQQDSAMYALRIQQVLDGMAGLSLLFAAAISIAAPWLIAGLFGEAYVGADKVLVVHVWAGLFVAFGVVTTRCLIAEGMQHQVFRLTMMGAAANVLLNLALIPPYGAVGAALATLASQAISLGSIGFSSRGRELLRMVARAFLFTSLRRRHA